MSEQELNSILEEIKNRGKNPNEDADKPNPQDINFAFNSAEKDIDEEESVSAEALDNSEEPLEEEAKDEPAFEEEEITPEAEDKTVVFEQLEELPTAEEYEELPKEEVKKTMPKNKKIMIAVIAVVVAIAVIVAGIFAVKAMNKEPETTAPSSTTQPTTEPPTEPAPTAIVNPLTGEGDYNENAIGKRPVAVVVENEYSTESVRPQWGLSDADIVLEGESEYSTRLLLFWADYTTVPKQVGPARSARPPFIKFSELFDAVFIHAGLSHSKGNYVGANSVFKRDNVDHINLLNTSSQYFSRDKSRTSTIEHTGVLHGENVSKMLEAYKIETSFEPEKYTQLGFNEQATDLGETVAKSISFRWTGNGKGRCPKTGRYTYNETDKVYTTTDFDSKYGTSNVKWTNLVFLLDNTEYVVKSNYKGSGKSETYCNYKLSGGKGLIASNGTAVEITWGVSNGKLWFKDVNGNEVKLNPGKTYIGYGSQNYGGSYSIEG